MASKTSWIRRFPWFMILVLILCAVLTALLVSTVNDARDTTEALLEHFRGIDAVLKLAMEVVRWAVFAEWVMLGLNVFGALLMVIIVWRSVKRTTDIKQGNRDDSGGGHAGTLVIVSAVVALAFCTVVASVVLAGAEVAWLEIFIVARTLAREGENLLTKATDVRSPACILMKQQLAQQWSSLTGSDFPAKAATLTTALSALNDSCSATPGSCSAAATDGLSKLDELSSQLLSAADDISTIAGVDCPSTTTCIGLNVAFLSDASGCICEDKMQAIRALANEGIKHTAQGLALAFILLIVWLLYYGRTCAVLMSVYSGNLWSRYLVEERASHTSADHVYNQASIEPRVGQSKAGSVRSVEMVPRLPNVRDGRL